MKFPSLFKVFPRFLRIVKIVNTKFAENEVHLYSSVYLRSDEDCILEAVLMVSPKRQYRGILLPTTPATMLPKVVKKHSHIIELFSRLKHLYCFSRFDLNYPLPFPFECGLFGVSNYVCKKTFMYKM